MKKLFIFVFLFLIINPLHSQVPNPPTLTSPPNGSSGVSIHPTFSWSAVPGATAYILHVSKSSLFDSLVVCDTTPLSTVTLEYNNHYYWRVFALNGSGISNSSTIWSFLTVPPNPPDPPVLLSPADSSTIPVIGQIFDWSEPVGAVSYRIQISTSPTFATTVLNQVTGSASQYTVSSPIFTSNTLYYWRVNATNSGGTGGWSGVWRVITQVSLPMPPALYPINRGNPVYLDYPTIIEWARVYNATSYRVVIATAPSFTNVILDTVVSDTIVIVPPNTFIAYTMHYLRVASINQGGQGNWSSVWIIRPIHSPLPVPVLLSPPDTAQSVSLTPAFDWSDVIGAASYRFQISTVQNFSTIVLSVSGLTNSGYTLSSNILSFCTKYYWRVKAFATSDSSLWSSVRSFTTICPPGVKQISSEIPSEYKLYNNYPNPFNPNTNIRYQITNSSKTSLVIYNITGKEIMTLINEKQPPGIYEVAFDGSNLPSGVYFYRLQSGDFVDTKKMLMIK